MEKLTENDILSIEAVLYACMKNKRVITNSIYVKNITKPNKTKSIEFDEAISNVIELLEKYYEEKEEFNV